MLKGSAAELENNVANNGEIALLAGTMPSHQTFQFKGKGISIVEASESDYSIESLFIQKLIGLFGDLGQSQYEPILNAMKLSPSIAVTFQVHDIFDQTPGPNAGTKVYSKEAHEQTA